MNEWDEINLLYELKSPVHVGYLPGKASVISSTRYYIPGKNFWGAYTKILTEKLFDNPTSKNYDKVGTWLKNNVKFTYFYIYFEDSNDWKLLSPNYSDEELKYGKLSLSEFQNLFIGSFISTAINEKGTAKDESLHEIEFIRSKYQSKDGIANTRIYGKMFIKKSADNEINLKVDQNGISVNGEDPFNVVFIGGELNYGFGKLERVKEHSQMNVDFNGFNLKSGDVFIEYKDKGPISGHLHYSEKYQFIGDIELISGRGYKQDERETHKHPGKDIIKPKPFFTPGTKIYNNVGKIKLSYDGSLCFKDE